MDRPCPDWIGKIDAALDSELPAAEMGAVTAHLGSCAACHSEQQARASLKERLRRLVLPPAPRRFTMADLRPARTWRWTAAAAAVLVMALVLLSLPAPLPEVVALSVQLHEDFLAGRLAPDPAGTVRPGNLGLKVAVPGTEYVGDCCCRGPAPASPLIVYRKSGVPITLLIVEAASAALPERSLRRIDGRPVHAFRAGPDTVIVCPSGKVCHVWVARLEEKELLNIILATTEGRKLFAGERLTIEGVTCRACCSLLETRVRQVEGVKDAALDPVSMELVVSSEGGKVDLSKVIRAIQEAGFSAKPAR